MIVVGTEWLIDAAGCSAETLRDAETLRAGAAAFAVWRAGCRFLWPRLVLTTVAAVAVAAVDNVPPAVPLAIMLVGMAAGAVIEQYTDPNPANPAWRVSSAAAPSPMHGAPPRSTPG